MTVPLSPYILTRTNDDLWFPKDVRRREKNCKRTQLILGEEDWNVWVRQAAGVNSEGLQEKTKLSVIRIQEALCQR